MIEESTLRTIESRLALASGASWALSVRDGAPVVVVTYADGNEALMTAKRDSDSAAPTDVEFIGYLRQDLRRLLAHLRGVELVDRASLDEIQRRLNAASGAPWTEWLESEGTAGDNIIWVSDGDDRDLYLYLDGRLAPDDDYRLIALARNALPDLIGQAMRRDEA